MSSGAPAGDAEPPDIEAGLLLNRALHLFDNRLPPDGSRRAGVLLSIALIAAATVISISAVIGFAFFIGAGTEWLRDRVDYFEIRPRVAAVVTTFLATSIVTVAFVAGRASVGQRDEDRSQK